ncbi:MAG: hypothetical protein OEU26_12270 [Candidatus Tectomicrobia bacterium]|nr:hypothetical protein [Candidatus Tectomicrobia bacterium]
MATKLPGETYRGEALHVPLSADGQVAAYVWPLRILTVGGQGCGGPTIGVDVGNEEVLRFDCHDALGHWHGGGYDRLERPRESRRSFPDDVQRVEEQVAWALQQIQHKSKELLDEADYRSAARMLETGLVQTAIDAIKSHLDKQGDLRSKAIKENLIAA